MSPQRFQNQDYRRTTHAQSRQTTLHASCHRAASLLADARSKTHCIAVIGASHAIVRPRHLLTQLRLALVMRTAAATCTAPAESLHQQQHASEPKLVDHPGRRIDPVRDHADYFRACLARRGRLVGCEPMLTAAHVLSLR
jgi:hypothetical protein